MQQPDWDPGLLSGCWYALILLGRGVQPVLVVASHAAGMKAKVGENLGSKLLVQGC